MLNECLNFTCNNEVALEIIQKLEERERDIQILINKKTKQKKKTKQNKTKQNKKNKQKKKTRGMKPCSYKTV